MVKKAVYIVALKHTECAEKTDNGICNIREGLVAPEYNRKDSVNCGDKNVAHRTEREGRGKVEVKRAEKSVKQEAVDKMLKKCIKYLFGNFARVELFHNVLNKSIIGHIRTGQIHINEHA